MKKEALFSKETIIQTWNYMRKIYLDIHPLQY